MMSWFDSSNRTISVSEMSRVSDVSETSSSVFADERLERGSKISERLRHNAQQLVENSASGHYPKFSAGAAHQGKCAMLHWACHVGWCLCRYQYQPMTPLHLLPHTAILGQPASISTLYNQVYQKPGTEVDYDAIPNSNTDQFTQTNVKRRRDDVHLPYSDSKNPNSQTFDERLTFNELESGFTLETTV